MPGPTKAELEGSISDRLRQLEAAFREYTVVTNLRLDLAERKSADRERADQNVQAKLAALEANDAGSAERARMLEKLSDRGWGLTQAILIAVLSLICGAVITLLVQLRGKL